ncbi:MAG: hypothetical protein CMO12_04035 [Thaumarchaeota archaeon]|jgi:ABC-type sugar transport system ATPase subunit|nr:hypothetical protein [Nitrososphaerota archaeon]|tara:strand:+ start:1104 stop:1877 length:774 start_codon:yes stop_codon:yes gene_type:complete
MESVRAESVSKSFKDVVSGKKEIVHVLQGLSIEVSANEVFAIIGHTGSGKTTLLRILSGLDKPDSGKVFIGGIPRERIRVGTPDVQMVFQDYALWPHMTVYNNLNFPLKQRRLPDREILERVKDMANRVGIPDSLFKRLPDQLSEGQKQMVAIGRSLMTRPKLLLLDEALVHLDPITKLKVRDEILDLQEEFQMTILMVTHQLTDALALADRIGVLYGGRIIQVATPDRLLNEPENDYVRAYIEASRLLPERRRRRS